MKKIGKNAVLALALAVSFIFPAYAEDEVKDTWISETARNACVAYGEQYDILPELLMAIIERESSGDPEAENGGCYGLMQISTRWHKDRMRRLEVTDIFDEDGNILVGTDYLAELSEKYDDIGVALMVYHGESNARNKKLSKYARGVLNRSSELEELHSK